MVCRQLYAPWIEHRADMTFGPRGLPLPSAVSLYRSKFIRLNSRRGSDQPQ